MEFKEQQLIKDISSKFQVMQEGTIRARDGTKARQVEMTDQLQKLEVKNTEMEYKIAHGLKQIEMHSQILSN